MYIQKVRQERRQVVDGDGRTRTVSERVPDPDTLYLTHRGVQYATQGNGVFFVPDEVGAELVGGWFKDVSDVRGAPIRAPRPRDLPGGAAQAAAATGAEKATEAPKKTTKPRKAAAKKAE